MARSIPAPPDAGLLNAVRFGTDTRRFLEGIQSRFDDAARIPVPGRAPLVVLTDPGLVHEALARPAEFSRIPTQESAAMIAERSIVQSDGELWRQQRGVMNPAFAGRQTAVYADAAGERADALAAEWAERDPGTVDLHREMTSLTLRVASEVLLGRDLGADRARRFHEWMEAAAAQLEFGLDVASPEWLPERVSPEFERAAGNIRELTEELIERRREELAEGVDPDRVDVLTLLLSAEDDPEVAYPPGQIRDEVATMLVAGHETTALSLSYALTLLSEHPEIRRRLREEAREVLGDGPPTAADVGALSLANRVYREAIRLYPPAWAIFRRASGDLRLGEYVVPEGSAVVMPQWSIHRDPDHFRRPAAFDPDRWERRDPEAVDAYFPFASGPHACVGKRFALAGGTLTLARLVREFDVEVAADQLRDLRISATLRPVDGIEARIEPAG